MLGTQWARLRTDASVPLRRGAWYRVVRMTPTDVVLDVHQRQINVPKSVLQMAPRPSQAWAIVPRPTNARHLPQSWGARYAVCPSCHGRSPLPKAPIGMRCPRCNGVFDVGWGDAYYA
jgi:hypothetical protein